jgi:hypothetical protein
MVKGTSVYKSFEDARKYVLDRREEMRRTWEANRVRPAARAASA